MKRPRVLLLAALIGLCLPGIGLAQDEAASPKEAAQAAPIAASAVLSEADRAFRTLDAIEGTFEPSPVVDGIEARLPGAVTAIDQQQKRAAHVLERTTSFDTVDELESQWTSLDIDLPAWREELDDRLGNVVDALALLNESRRLWEATRQEARKTGAPEAVKSRIAEVLAGLGKAIEAGNRRQSALLTARAAVAAQESRVDKALSALRASREQLVSRVFERESPPVWAPELGERLTLNLGARIAKTAREQIEELQTFVPANTTGMLLQLLLFALLAALLFAARSRVRRRSEEEQGLARVAEIFEFPVPVALLLAILAAPSIYRYLPPIVGQALGAAALVPTVLIVRRMVPKQLYPLLYGLVGFYFADRLRELAAPLPALARILFLLEMLAAVLLLAWRLRPALLSEIPAYASRSSLRIIGFAGRCGLGLLAAAFTASAIGYGRLGNLVGSAALDSAYVAIVAYASVRVLDSLVTFALRVWPLGALHFVARSRYAIRRRLHRLLVLAAYFVWASATFELLAIRQQVAGGLRGVVSARLVIGSISLSLGDVLAFVLTVWGAFLLSRFLRYVLEEDVYPRIRLARGVPYAASSLIHYTLLLVGFLLAVIATGIDLDRFALLAGAFGVGIGFGLQNVVNNFVSGLILLWERPVQVGDMLEAGDAFGEMKRIGIRSSTLRTLNGAELIVPNAELISQRVINWTLSDRQRRIDLAVGVAYGTDRRRVIELLQEVARANENVLGEPAPIAIFIGFGDSSLDFELRAWTVTGAGGEIARVRSDLALAVGDALDEEDITIPFPQRDLHVRSIVEPGD